MKCLTILTVFPFLGALLLLCAEIKSVSGAKILVPFFLGTTSHRNAFEPLLIELAKRGHQITIISSNKSSKRIENIRDLHSSAMLPQNEMFPNIFEQKLQGKEFELFEMTEHFAGVCHRYYDMPEVKEILKESFDLLFLNAFCNECTFGLVHHFNVSFIFLSSMPTPSWIASELGYPSVPSFNPFLLYGLTDEMTFPERIKNVFGHVKAYYLRNFRHNQQMEKVYRNYFPDAPSVSEIEKKASLLFVNTHVSINFPRPKLPDLIEVGGLNCSPPKSLPKELQNFLDGSGKDGFIYFSMGSFIQASTLPEYLRLEIVHSFSKLKQRVLWKWETEKMENLPPNVKLAKWLPQQDILAHKKIRMFITHGGILSLQEAICFGVPLIGIPMFTDQHGNLELSKKRGLGVILQLRDLNEKSLTNSINKILSDPTFQRNAKSLSGKFLDNPISPMDLGIFWTEYVIRHNGAAHLRSPARDLNFFQYHSLDVLLACFLVLISVTWVLYMVFTLCLKYVNGRFFNSKSKQTRKLTKRD